ncbi:MAG: hypothetical protein Salg2KO_01580 [Salibacteraceae bacterium]
MTKHSLANVSMVLGAVLLSTFTLKSQNGLLEGIQIHGNYDIYAQVYQADSATGAATGAEKSGFNSFANVIATKGAFTAGARLEAYMPPVQGYPENFGNQTIGLPFRYIQYNNNGLDITLGNFFEQFGSGMILRAYEERALGVDNAFDGIRVKYSPYRGVYVKGLVGNQRFYWAKSNGIVRGADVEWSINEFFPSLADKPLRLTFGGSFVSKYEAAGTSSLEIPENVASWAARTQLNYKGFAFLAEYAYKFNDPSTDNFYIYRPGQGVLISGTYSRKGFGINLTAKSIDNMSYRSNRDAIQNDLFINYLPALTRQHTYNLAATLYPYATQPRGEIGLQADIIYKIKKGTAIGGKYGTTIQINGAIINNLDTHQISTDGELSEEVYLPNDRKREGYTANLYSFGKSLYHRDYNIEIARKFSKSFKLKTTYMYTVSNIDITQGEKLGRNVYAHIAILDGLYKISRKHSIRTELQHLWTEQHLGDWAFALIEYSYSPHWFITVLDQYNYGNSIVKDRLHYPTVQVAYVNKANRISIGYGRQRAGIFCVGGICRQVPAATGLTMAITSSF